MCFNTSFPGGPIEHHYYIHFGSGLIAYRGRANSRSATAVGVANDSYVSHFPYKISTTCLLLPAK
jgi:hypothetical protein